VSNACGGIQQMRPQFTVEFMKLTVMLARDHQNMAAT
jgi:hypothetical protein